MPAKDYEFPNEKQCLIGLKNISKIRGEMKRIKAKRDRKKIHTLDRIRIRANQLQARVVQ
ncbi:hypothetical protein AB733_20015 [Photobacterium swingsii]|uniref:Uncharacterized protein n=1 Tax=Photobacterium swingsii TaxID=680026 RepID=A0A0J8V743_9GAMM|nr:hypothetical protein [Photobacterium swingsii]KMV29066.1 hypothetical protein AB733_20015 [Photobacterium swingsii]PSW19113.1 hypothetical protein C9I94_23875 [Photobacterium swingsii]